MNINLQSDQQQSEQLNYIHWQENIKAKVLLSQTIEPTFHFFFSKFLIKI
jgi:hypothetical protein